MLPGQIPIALSMARISKVTLEERYAADASDTLSFYRKRLLEPGWAGELDSVELAYIKSEVRRSASLRRRWGFRPSARRLSDFRIQAIARDGLFAHKKPVLASVAGKQKSVR